MADDPFPYPELRNASHEFFAKVWRAQKSGSVKGLSHEGQRLAQRMASHPEWQAWWERADDLGDGLAVTGAGVNRRGADRRKLGRSPCVSPTAAR